MYRTALCNSVGDPEPRSGAFLTPGSGIRDGEKSGSGMNIPDNFFESFETVFRANSLKRIRNPVWKNSDPV